MLSEIEKHAVEGMVLRGMTKSEIHKIFPQDKWKDVDSQIKKSPKGKVADKTPYDRRAVLAKLAKAGIHGKDADRLIERALQNVSSRPEVMELYNEVINLIGPRELMVTETANGNSGVVAMTGQASSKGEKIGGSKTEKSYVFKPNSGETDAV